MKTIKDILHLELTDEEMNAIAITVQANDSGDDTLISSSLDDAQKNFGANVMNFLKLYNSAELVNTQKPPTL